MVYIACFYEFDGSILLRENTRKRLDVIRAIQKDGEGDLATITRESVGLIIMPDYKRVAFSADTTYYSASLIKSPNLDGLLLMTPTEALKHRLHLGLSGIIRKVYNMKK